MQFILPYTPKKSIFLPYTTHEQEYHLLFRRVVPRGTTLSVVDSEVVAQTFFRIGNLLVDGYGGERCGFIFYSTLPILCQGSSILAYSRQWAKSVNEKKFPINPFGVSLILRGNDFHLYHKKNQASLAVSPNIAARIRGNLEV